MGNSGLLPGLAPSLHKQQKKFNQILQKHLRIKDMCVLLGMELNYAGQKSARSKIAYICLKHI